MMVAAGEAARFEQLVLRFDPRSRLLRTWQLPGGVSALVTVLELVRPDGQIVKWIVRRHGEAETKRNPHIAAAEFRLLHGLHSAGLAVPEPFFFDLSCEIFPTPYLVIEYVEGSTQSAPSTLADFVRQIASQLARIHQVSLAQLDLSSLPQDTRGFGAAPPVLDSSLGEERIRAVLESLWPLPQRNETVLLHGDYWPGNLLWKDGQLVAVLDWEDAHLGDPLADVANCRLELLWARGSDAMHRFTECYQAITSVDFTYLPYWDLCAALRPASKIGEWGLDQDTENAMREGHRLFVHQAIESIGRLL